MGQSAGDRWGGGTGYGEKGVHYAEGVAAASRSGIHISNKKQSADDNPTEMAGSHLRASIAVLPGDMPG